MSGTWVRANAPAATVLIRIMVGGVFLSEGIQKFLFPDELGVGRFARIGLPAPEVLAPFVGACEIVFGSVVLAGLATRLAAIPLLLIIIGALATTKFPLLGERGFWHMAHEARTDASMFLGSLFLFLLGAGPWSIDSRLASRTSRRNPKG